MRLFLCSFLFWGWLSCRADTVLVNNKLTTQTTIYRHEIQSIFMLHPTYWSNGDRIIPIFIDFDDISHLRFVSDVLHISPINFEIVMQDKLQRGDASQYIMVPNAHAAVVAVQKTPGSIAYIPSIMSQDSSNIQVMKIRE